MPALNLRGFSITFAGRHRHIEQMNLVIARPDGAVGCKQERAVGGLFGADLDMKRADRQPDAQFFRKACKGRQRWILGLVEGGGQLGAVVLRHDVGVFGRGDETGPASGGLTHECGCPADILRHIPGGTKLDTGSLKRSGTGHAWSITDPALKTRKPPYLNYQYLPAILASPARTQTSSLSPPGAPDTAK